MIYKMTLKDSVDEMMFNLLETPIVDRDIEGAVDNITLDGNQYTDYLYLKKQYIQKWAVMCPDEYDQLRGFYTRQFEEGTTPSYRVYYGSNIERDYTFNGDFVQFNAKGFETSMSLTQLTGNAEQNGTPTPDAPVPVDVVTGEQSIVVEKDGKNLWNGEFRQGSWYSGSVPNRIFSTQVLKVESGVTYTISTSLDYSAFVFAVNLRTVPYGTATPALSYDSGWKTDSFTFTPAQDGYFGVIISRSDGTSNLTPSDIDGVNFQLEKSNSASPYEPYVATNQEINLGKNLTDLSTFSSGYVNGSGTISPAAVEAGEMYSPFIKVFPNTAYTFKIVETAGTYASWFGVGEYTSNSESSFVKRDTNAVTTATSIIFMTSATTNYVRVSARNLSLATKVQLEKGLASTSWAEYFPPIELAKIGTYQDRIYKDNDKWYIEKQTQTLQMANNSDWGGGTLCTNYPSLAYFYSRQFDAVLPTITAVDSASISTFAKPSTAFYNASPATFFDGSAIFAWDVNTTGANRLRIAVPATFVTGSTDAQRLASWKTQLDVNDFYIIAPLATPTTTEITDQTLLEQLEHIYQLYGGVNNISIVGAGNGEIEVFIRDVIDAETDVVPEVPVRLTLTDEGVINACGCRRNVQLTMRETIEE